MCGIIGILNINRKQDSTNLVKEMADMIIHRGPDQEGYYSNSEITMGHKRLSIIDLSIKGRQPLFNENEDISLVFNGEIYNFKSLRKELQSKGYRFKSQTDSEVIVYAYEEWDEYFVEKLEGMFALAIWDQRENKLLLARDRLGIKPLYYLQTSEYFAFSSEVKAFLPLRNYGFPISIDEESVSLFLDFSFIPDSEKTMIRHVKKLQPGYQLIINNGKISKNKYWGLSKNMEYTTLSFDESVKELEKLLSKSISERLVADVPLGILLSGGLDSSSLAALANEVSTSRPHTFTVGFDHPLDERRYAKQVADHLGTIHTEIEIDINEPINRFEEIVWYLDDLSSSDGGIFSTYIISEKIRERGIKVVLVGEGSDEILGGYPRFSLSQLPFRIFPKPIKSMLNYYGWSRRFPEISNYKNILKLHRWVFGTKESDIFRCISNYEITHQLPNHLLMKVDKSTMAHSLEARVPFLDHNIVEFLYSLPRKYKLKGQWFSKNKSNEKFILRQVAKKYLPTETIQRKKRGFLFPITDFLRNDKNKIRSYLLDNEAVSKSLFSVNKIENILKEKNNYLNIEKNIRLIWRLYLLEVWSSKYINKEY